MLEGRLIKSFVQEDHLRQVVTKWHSFGVWAKWEKTNKERVIRKNELFYQNYFQ